MTTDRGIVVPTLAEAARLLRTGKLTSTELLDLCLSNIDRHEASLNAFACQTRESAVREARHADQQIARGKSASALQGIPYTLKDVIETSGVRTAAQSRSLESHVPAVDATVAARLKQAGGVCVGKATTWEFSHGGPSWDILQTPARNPWHLDHDPSGSSSGSAAGIAAGFALGSIGTDTGGSIRGPAAACGITGLKPTYGLVSRFGVITNSFTQDHVGPLAWTAEDAAILLQQIAGHDANDASSARQAVPDYTRSLNRSLEGLRIGVPYAWFENELVASDMLYAGVINALEVLISLGAKVVRVAPPRLAEFDDAKKVIAAVELFASHGHAMRETPERFGEVFRVRVFGGALLSAEQYFNAQRQRKVIAARFQGIWSQCDMLALPTAEPAGHLEAKPAEDLFWKLSYATPANVAGNPALATRCGFTPDGMPLSIQFVGQLFDEATVLNVAHRYETATDWKTVRPAFRTS